MLQIKTEKFIKKDDKHEGDDPNDYFDEPKEGVELQAAEAGQAVSTAEVKITNEMTAEEKADADAQAKWLHPSDESPWKKGLLLLVVFFCLWVFLLTLSVMGTGFKLLGGKDSARMFDVVDNPISGVMIGILATVLVQSSSTTTSIIISLVGADELSVRNAVFMVMGANIGTSVTNTIVAMGHFANPDDLRRGFSAATVHDCFNLLTVMIFLPLNWIYPFLDKMTFEMAKDQKACDVDDGCVKREFLKPYISPYSKGIAGYDKKVAGYISEGYCAGQCGKSYSSSQMKAIQAAVCADGKNDCKNIHKNFQASWVAPGYLNKKRAPGYIKTDASGKATAGFAYTCPVDDCSTATKFFVNDTATAVTLAPNTVYEVCGSKVKTGLCDQNLLKGGIADERWEMTDNAAGTFLTIISLMTLCSCLFLIVYFLQIIVKGTAARILRRVVGFNGYVNIIIGMGITILVQSSSITTSTLTPLAAVGLINLEDMLPLTLGANIGTTLTGIMGATVVTSNPVAAWQVALCHLFFNIFGILVWYPVPKMRNVPLSMAKILGKHTTHPKYGKVFPLVYTFIVFFVIPGICYGIAVAATQ